MTTTTTSAQAFQEAAKKATETWSAQASADAQAAAEAWEQGDAPKARRHATAAAEAAWLAELAAIAAGDERSDSLRRAAQDHAEYAEAKAKQAEAQERWNAGTELLKALHEYAEEQ